ncbi:hypothetical protein [Maribellus maritimus]|uniref:hypothetical protein n=1 Tax=Maribellus maritimus TaxID=2870838 RepID=UPI001EEB019B|nr:hypothetical protein [Maribellus maritimus]MCG6189005.1 hypothetical protein [Maribellus maritimus]
MKTTCLNLIFKNIFIASVLIAMISCNKETENPPGGDHLTPEEIEEQAFLGVTVPFLIQEDSDGIYTVGLSPHARPFSFSEKLTDGTKHLKLLKDSKETDIPVRVYVYPNTNDIWWVEEATKEDIQKYEAAKQQKE